MPQGNDTVRATPVDGAMAPSPVAERANVWAKIVSAVDRLRTSTLSDQSTPGARVPALSTRHVRVTFEPGAQAVGGVSESAEATRSG